MGRHVLVRSYAQLSVKSRGGRRPSGVPQGRTVVLPVEGPLGSPRILQDEGQGQISHLTTINRSIEP